MDRKVDIRDRSLLLEGFFTVEEVQVSYERFDGTMSQPVRRLNLARGEAVAVLLYNKARGRVVLVEQFRYATLALGSGWTTEVIAGVVDAGETPEATARRETREETGYDIGHLERIASFYPTPGITSERIHLFYAETRGEAPVAKGGGLVEESEDIAVIELAPAEAFARLDRGELPDAKTIIGLMWLRARLGGG